MERITFQKSWEINPLNCTVLKIYHQKLLWFFFFCNRISITSTITAWNEDKMMAHEHIKIINEIIRIVEEVCAPCLGEGEEKMRALERDVTF